MGLIPPIVVEGGHWYLIPLESLLSSGASRLQNSTKSYLFAFAAVLSWSTVATAFKLALRELTIFQLIFLACLTANVVLLMALAMRGELPKLRDTFREHWKITLVSGVLSPFVYYLVLFSAYDRLPAQVAQPINYTWAIVLTFLSIVILKQRITAWDIGAAFICYAGVVVIAGQGQVDLTSIPDLGGIALALASTVIWACYWILNIRDVREPTMALCLNFLLALPLTAMACVVFSNVSDITWSGAAAAIYVGIFEMGLAFLCWSNALRYAENTSRVSNLIFLSPFLSLVFINQVLGEPIFVTTYVGLVVIVAGLLLQQWGRRRKARD